MKFLVLIFLINISFVWGQEPSVLPTEPAQPVVAKQFSRIWLKFDIVPMNFSWQDLGLTKEASFTAPLGAAWKKWLTDNLPATVGDVEVCAESCLTYLAEWEAKPQDHVNSESAPEYASGVWLRVNLNIWKKGEGEESENAFYWEGRAVLLDIKTKRVLGSLVLPLEDRNFLQLDPTKTSTVLANQVFRTPLSAFLHFNKTLTQGLQLNQVANIKIIGQKNLGDAVELMQLLQTRGSHLGLVTSLENFKKDEAQVLCFYRGEEKSFSDLLSQLKELKSSNRYTLVNQSTGPMHVIQLVTE